jgi:hypothetical protein
MPRQREPRAIGAAPYRARCRLPPVALRARLPYRVNGDPSAAPAAGLATLPTNRRGDGLSSLSGLGAQLIAIRCRACCLSPTGELVDSVVLEAKSLLTAQSAIRLPGRIPLLLRSSVARTRR